MVEKYALLFGKFDVKYFRLGLRVSTIYDIYFFSIFFSPDDRYRNADEN